MLEHKFRAKDAKSLYTLTKFVYKKCIDVYNIKGNEILYNSVVQLYTWYHMVAL